MNKKIILYFIVFVAVAIGIYISYKIWIPIQITENKPQSQLVSKSDNETKNFLGNESEWQNIRIELKDIQGLWGGRNIFIIGSGKTIIQIVNPDSEKGLGLFEKRYTLSLDDYEIKGLIDTFIKNDFVTIKLNDRPGVPDEAKPEIILINSRGEYREVSKWQNDKNERFDMIYQQILEIEKKTEKLIPTSEFQWNGVGATAATFSIPYKAKGNFENLYKNLVEADVSNNRIKEIINLAKKTANQAGYPITGNELNFYLFNNRIYPLDIKVYENNEYYVIKLLPKDVPITSQDLEVSIQKGTNAIITILKGS